MKKFRVWDSERQQYRKSGELSFNLDNQNWYFNQANYQDIIIEQSTGLHDCKGVEIFENDKGTNLSGLIWTVRWCQEESAFRLFYEQKENGDCPLRQQWIIESNFEVIGNIHLEGK